MFGAYYFGQPYFGEGGSTQTQTISQGTPWTVAARNTNQWVVVGRGNTTWSNESIMQVGYLYDSATITYDNAFSYDYLSPVANQSNNKNNTQWTNNT